MKGIDTPTGQSDALGKVYRTTALVLTNTLLIFLVANIFLAMSFSLNRALFVREMDRPTYGHAESKRLFNEDGSPINNGKRTDYQMGWIDFHAYEDIEPTYVGEVLDDFFGLSKAGFTYQPWVHFAEPPFKGKRVEVELDERNFPIRHTANTPNSDGLPVVRIVTLGGSTTFGYNVSDEHTWPSYLSKILNERARAKMLGIHIEVVNYGRGFYNPSQEVVLITDLLKNGHRPNLAIFMDGVNVELKDVPSFYDKFERQFKAMQFGSASSTDTKTSILEQLEWVPVVHLAQSIQNKVFGKKNTTEKKEEIVKDYDANDAMHTINQFNQNREIARSVGRLYSVDTLFFIQPNAVYNYPIDLYRISVPESFKRLRKLMQPFYDHMRNEKGIIFLGDLFSKWGQNRKAIVDEVHYSPAFNRFLAEQVANYIDVSKLTPRQDLVENSATTGLIRDLPILKGGSH